MRYLCALALLSGLFFINSCTTDNNETPNPIDPNAVAKVKERIISMAFSNPTLQKDTISCSFIYDDKNRPVRIKYDELYKNQNYTIKRLINLTYTDQMIVQTQTAELSPDWRITTTYYLNPITKFPDSLIETTNTNNTNVIVCRVYYSGYNSEGGPGVADSSTYNASTGELRTTSHTTYNWSGRNINSLTTQHSSGESYTTSYTYGATPAPVKTSPGFSFMTEVYYEYVAFPFQDIPLTKKVLRNGNAFRDFTFTVTLDAQKRAISRTEILAIPNSSASQTNTWTYNY